MVHAQVEIKHNTVCTIACLTPLQYATHGNNSHYISGDYFIKITTLLKSVNKCVLEA